MLVYIFKSMKQTCNKSIGILFCEQVQTLVHPVTSEESNNNNKNLGTTHTGFDYFLVSETPSGTLKLVLNLVLQTFSISYEILAIPTYQYIE